MGELSDFFLRNHVLNFLRAYALEKIETRGDASEIFTLTIVERDIFFYATSFRIVICELEPLIGLLRSKANGTHAEDHEVFAFYFYGVRLADILGFCFLMNGMEAFLVHRLSIVELRVFDESLGLFRE